jgi:hypothetical protein
MMNLIAFVSLYLGREVCGTTVSERPTKELFGSSVLNVAKNVQLIQKLQEDVS